MAGVPAYITPLSYIRGSGTQYITTEINLRSTDVVKSKWRFENSAGNVYGCFTSSGADDNFCLYAGSASNNAYIRYNGQLVRDFKAVNGTIYNIEQGPDGFFANGSKEADFDAASFTCSAPMYIFMLPNSSSAKVTARCYGLTVYRGGEQFRNFIPARNELTGEVGFYESVQGVFYENAGTDAFTEGPEVNFSVKTLLLKRRRALLGIVPAPIPTELVTEYREYIADADAKTLSTGGNTLAVCQKYVNPAQTTALCLTTAYVTFENNTATGNKARAVWYVKGAPCFYVRGTNSTPVAGNPNTAYDFFYTMGTIIKVYIMKDPTDF